MMSYTTYVPPFGYEVVSSGYLAGLKEAAMTSDKRKISLDKQGKEIAALREENGELKDILKQAMRIMASREGYSVSEGYSRNYILGARADLRIEITKDPGIFSETDRRRVKVYVPKKEDPDEKVLELLKKKYPYGTKDILTTIRQAGLDITLKDQGKAAIVNTDATSLKLVS